MKLFFAFISALLLGGCSIGQYYVLEEGDDEIRAVTLYRNQSISIDIEFFTGHISRIYFLNLDHTENLDFEILSIQHAVSISGVPVKFKSAQGYEPKMLELAENDLYVSEKRYELATQPRNVVEHVKMSLLTNGAEVEISEEFLLRKITYNYFHAMQGI